MHVLANKTRWCTKVGQHQRHEWYLVQYAGKHRSWILKRAFAPRVLFCLQKFSASLVLAHRWMEYGHDADSAGWCYRRRQIRLSAIPLFYVAMHIFCAIQSYHQCCHKACAGELEDRCQGSMWPMTKLWSSSLQNYAHSRSQLRALLIKGGTKSNNFAGSVITIRVTSMSTNNISEAHRYDQALSRLWLSDRMRVQQLADAVSEHEL